MACKCHSYKQEVSNSSILDSASVSQSASSGLCRFACSNCSSIFQSWEYLQFHEKKVHNNSIHQWNVEAFLFKASVHICKICSQKVLSDFYFLNVHFINTHGMYLSKYRQLYNCNSVQNIKITHLSRRTQNAKESDNEIGNFCVFKCPGCKKIFETKSTLYHHCSPKLGNCQQLESSVDWRTCIEEVVTHKCKMCSKLLLCDNSLIVMHVWNAHNIKSIGEYAKKAGCTLKIVK